MIPDKIYLVGFMGSGKTTVARALARRLGWMASDIDDLIEQREHMTVADIFARRGEPYFRTAERAVLRDQVPTRHMVVATGGGTFVDPENRALINADGVSIWLDAPLESLVGRVPTDGRRPLASNRADFERLYRSRVPAYQQAHVRFDATGASIEELVDAILDQLNT